MPRPLGCRRILRMATKKASDEMSCDTSIARQYVHIAKRIEGGRLGMGFDKATRELWRDSFEVFRETMYYQVNARHHSLAHCAVII